MADINHVITLGVGTPGDIARFILLGLNPQTAVTPTGARTLTIDSNPNDSLGVGSNSSDALSIDGNASDTLATNAHTSATISIDGNPSDTTTVNA